MKNFTRDMIKYDHIEIINWKYTIIKIKCYSLLLFMRKLMSELSEMRKRDQIIITQLDSSFKLKSITWTLQNDT